MDAYLISMSFTGIFNLTDTIFTYLNVFGNSKTHILSNNVETRRTSENILCKTTSANSIRSVPGFKIVKSFGIYDICHREGFTQVSEILNRQVDSAQPKNICFAPDKNRLSGNRI